jgi:ABC-type dipeptide/oligopeptide/nickel transport system permease subunit
MRGFDVGEGLSVSCHDHGGSAAEQAARQAQAKQMAAEVWSRAAQLDSTEVRVAGQLTSATNGFASGATSAPAHGSGVQLVDFKQDGGSQPQPPPHILTTEEKGKGLLARVAEGAIIGGISGLPEGGVGAVPGMIIGGGLGRHRMVHRIDTETST